MKDHQALLGISSVLASTELDDIEKLVMIKAIMCSWSMNLKQLLKKIDEKSEWPFTY